MCADCSSKSKRKGSIVFCSLPYANLSIIEMPPILHEPSEIKHIKPNKLEEPKKPEKPYPYLFLTL